MLLFFCSGSLSDLRQQQGWFRCKLLSSSKHLTSLRSCCCPTVSILVISLLPQLRLYSLHLLFGSTALGMHGLTDTSEVNGGHHLGHCPGSFPSLSLETQSAAHRSQDIHGRTVVQSRTGVRGKDLDKS
eukprot:superscaffoldBa00000755_g7034